MPKLPLPSTVLRVDEQTLTLTEEIELIISVLPFMHYPRVDGEHEELRQKLRMTLSGYFQPYLESKKNRAKARGRRLKRAIVDVDKREVETFIELGGLAGLTEAPGTSHFKERGKKITKDWYSVFYLSWTLARLAKTFPNDSNKVSVNKVIHVALEQKGRHPLLHKNRDSLRKAWSEFKPVAHLCSAYIITQIALKDSTIHDPTMKLLKNLDVFFGLAIHFQGFLTSLKPSNSKLPGLISSDDMWFIPERLGIEQLEPPLDPLTEAEDEAYDRYKSPTPYD